MVRIMDKFLCKFRDNFINEKEFLSLDDVCYIFNKNGGDFHIDSEQQHEAERDYNRLKSVLYDLVTHNRITPVVCFDGKYEPYSYTAILETDINEIGETITIEREKQILNDGLYPKTDYIYLPRIYFKRLFNTNRNIQLSPLDNLTFYRYPPAEQLGDRYFKFYAYKNFKINPDSYIWFNDLCYPKEQILALFSTHKLETDNSELVQQLQAENERLRAELQKQLKQQAGKDTQSDTPADGEPTDKGQGDSLLILGAVMETMPKLKPNYTQQSHIAEILETYKSVSGISQSTLEKKFSQAKRYLKQCIN